MLRSAVLLICFPSFAWAQTVQITEIAPHTLAGEPEWFEFRVEDPEAVDMSTWRLSNGSNAPKAFADHIEKLHGGEDEYWYFSPSPLSLPNNGGTIQILDEGGTVLSEVAYPAAKSRSTKHYEQREVWNWSDEHGQLLPQLIRAPAQPGYEATPGAPNAQLPTPNATYSLLINEASPHHQEQDFIELLVKDGPEQINLQYTELKHNGTVLWRWDQPFVVSPQDYLLFKVGTPDHGVAGTNVWHTNAKAGLSAGSGTVELVGMSDTSGEARLDVVCWQNQKLSQTEQNRVNKFIADQDWAGPCVEIGELVKNESVARRLGAGDGQVAADWFRHFNGSAGAENHWQNQPPTAVITVQGNGKVANAVPFFLNVSGENSTDSDGDHDLKSYQWTFGNAVISSLVNPAGFYVETVGEFSLALQVTDYSGQAHATQQLIVGLEPGKNSNPDGSAAAKAAVVEQQIAASLESSREAGPPDDDFFARYLDQTHWATLVTLEPTPTRYPDYPVPTKPNAKTRPPLYQANWPRQINLPKPVRARARKNLGVLFSWRESPWPDLATEWTAVVAADRKSGYFGGVYLGF